MMSRQTMATGSSHRDAKVQSLQANTRRIVERTIQHVVVHASAMTHLIGRVVGGTRLRASVAGQWSRGSVTLRMNVDGALALPSTGVATRPGVEHLVNW